MKVLMTGLLPRLWFLIVVSMIFTTPEGMAASTAYVQTTRDLPLDEVELVVVAASDVKTRLYDRVRSLFAKADLLPVFHPSREPIARLILTLDPRPLDDTCPGKVLYAPSLTLREPVIIPRNSAVIHDSTWLLGTDRQVREPVGTSELETDLDSLVHQFITDYKTANPGWQLHKPPRAEPSIPVIPDTQDTRTDSSLKNLAVSRLSLSVMAGREAESLRTRAIHQLTEAGLPVSAERRGHTAVTVSIELFQRPLDDHCPGRVLYEQGLYLVEQVRIQRNPQVSIWSDTWLREALHIVPPVPIQQLQSDQDALLQQLIQAFQTK